MIADPIAMAHAERSPDAVKIAESLLASCLTWQSPELWDTLSAVQQCHVLRCQTHAEHHLRLAGLANRAEALVLSAEIAREISG